jgi:hypothetical protein
MMHVQADNQSQQYAKFVRVTDGPLTVRFLPDCRVLLELNGKPFAGIDPTDEGRTLRLTTFHDAALDKR